MKCSRVRGYSLVGLLVSATRSRVNTAFRWRGSVVAMGYTGPEALTLATAFTQWRADVPVIAGVVILSGAYLAGMRRARANGQPWAAGRAIAFCGLGLGVLVYATMSWVGVYQGILFYARATQTVLLVLVVPLFLAMGKPLTLLAAAAPRVG